MTLNISPEKMAEYRAGARKREAALQAAHDERFELAWQLARQGADTLRSQFGATRVVVCGSLVDHKRFLNVQTLIWLPGVFLNRNIYAL